ncbi:MAG: HAD family hydrolase [Clostridiales bacterium]|uniref:HAD family hydrolase n=1 Tax=Lacrimispora sp. TaxID=2719234 RepID=UPI0028AC66F4|nr:HAD family hydrolase [Lacrimispora sp.]MBS5958124.1 HAD family hydrolase [Clostridiales bacterium]
MYKCCIFDLDGTVLDTIASLSHSVSLAMAHFGYGPVDEEHTKKFVGDGYKKLVERALIYSGDEALVHYEEALSVYEKLFEENCLYEIKPYDGIPELLRFLKEKEIKIGILTNKNRVRAVECVETCFEPGYFDLIVGDGDGISLKPDPAGALFMAESFHVKPSECLYFGDTNTDMKTGIHAGMDTVGVTWGFRDQKELETFHPSFIIDHPEKIKHIFA